MKRFLIIILVIVFALTAIIGCKGKAKLSDKPLVTFELSEMYYVNPNQENSEIKTRGYGKLTFNLYTDDAKEAVDLFLKSAKQGYYNSKVEGNKNTRFRYQFNEPDHMYFMRIMFDIENSKFTNITREQSKWSKNLTPASNIKIKRGTLCLSSKLKSDLIIFKTKLEEAGDFIPIGQVTPDSIDKLEQMFNAPTNIGETQKTQQGTVVKSNPVNINIFIDKVKITE